MTLVLLLALTASDYDDARARLLARQVELRRQYLSGTAVDRDGIVRAARREVERALVHDLVPAWLGTTWEFYGTTQVPGQGAIACGYFVSTVLEHAGFAIERVRLAQQASERIIQSFTPESQIHRHRHGSRDEVVAAVAALGDGVYVVGLDFHVGLLVVADGEVNFCHSSYLPPVAVACKPAAEDAAMESSYHVVGRLFGDAMMRAWVTGAAIPTVTE